MEVGGQAVACLVCHLNGFFFRLECLEREDGPEDLIGINLAVGGRVEEDCRLDEVTFVALSTATRQHLGILLAYLQEVHDAVELRSIR